MFSFFSFFLIQGVPLVLIVLSGGWPSSNFEKLKRISTSLKNSVNIWTIGSGPSASAEYLKEIASKEEQSHKSIFFEQLFPVSSQITGKLCSGEVSTINENFTNICLFYSIFCLPCDVLSYYSRFTEFTKLHFSR